MWFLVVAGPRGLARAPLALHVVVIALLLRVWCCVCVQDPSDNLNLIQPVNPWLGQAPWTMYTEYYQWSDGCVAADVGVMALPRACDPRTPLPRSYNSNSAEYDVNAGQTLHGALVYLADQDAYNLTQTVVETGATSQQIVQCQDGKKFKVPYVVYEKVWDCADYPPDQIVTFTNIKIECDGKDCTNGVKWKPSVVDPNCDMTAHVDKYPQSLYITWSTSGQSKVAGWTDAQKYDYNYNGWAKKLSIPRPVE